jgi:hypothetical protein
VSSYFSLFAESISVYWIDIPVYRRFVTIKGLRLVLDQLSSHVHAPMNGGLYWEKYA